MMEGEPRDADLTLLKQNDIMNCFIKGKAVYITLTGKG